MRSKTRTTGIKHNMKTFFDISIIIPTYNSSKYIEKCLTAISDNNYPKEKFEIIVIDNGSTDETLSIVHKFTPNSFVYERVNISALRNLGVSKAKGSLVAFIDSDCIISKDWIASAIKIADNNPNNLGAAGYPYSLPDDPSWLERAWDTTVHARRKEKNFLSAGNILMRRSTFIRLGGFDEKMVTGEDYELCQRIRKAGLTIIFSPHLRAVHLGNPKSVYQLFKKELWYGKGMFGTLRNKEISKPFLLAIVYLFLCFGFIYGVHKYISSGELLILSLNILLFFSIPMFCAIYKTSPPRDTRVIIQLSLIFFVYILARMISLYYILEMTLKYKTNVQLRCINKDF